jgi:hypothetical protein
MPVSRQSTDRRINYTQTGYEGVKTSGLTRFSDPD